MQQHRWRADTFAEFFARCDRKAQHSGIEGHMAWVDFDEDIGDVMYRAPHGMSQAKEGCEHRFRINALGER